MTAVVPRDRPEAALISFFGEVLADIRRIMWAEYGLTHVSIRPIKSDGSRLSIPVRITGLNRRGERVRYFGKILGTKDLLTARSIQLAKNLFLEANGREPIFGFTQTAEEMARQQMESLVAIRAAGVPTARPLGYHWITAEMWLLVGEWLESHPFRASERLSPEQVDCLFGYLKRLHRRGVYHGDIKPENILVGAQLYLSDAGVFRASADAPRKQAYDLACLLCSVVDWEETEVTLALARRHYSRTEIRDAVKYLDLVQMRLDFHFDDREKALLRAAMQGSGLEGRAAISTHPRAIRVDARTAVRLPAPAEHAP